LQKKGNYLTKLIEGSQSNCVMVDIWTHTHIHKHTHRHKHLHTHIHTYSHIYTLTHTHMLTHTHRYTYTHICHWHEKLTKPYF